MDPSKGDTTVWHRVTRHSQVFRGMTVSQWIPWFWGVTKASQIHNEVRTKLVESNPKYKATVDKHKHFKKFKEGELVMIHLRKSAF